MSALSKKMLEQEPSDVELLLPWHAAGTLKPRDTRRVNQAIGRDRELARQYAVIREEYAEVFALNESLGAPSVGAMQKLFAAIDAEPESRPRITARLASRISELTASLSPRLLTWSASLGAIMFLVQAGVIGVVVSKNRSATSSASLGMNDLMVGDLGGVAPPRALVRFAPDTRMGDITALLDKYQASIIGTARGSMFRVQLGERATDHDDAAKLINKLSNEPSVSLAVPAP